MSSRNAVVTGGLGFIGQHLVKRLVDDGYDVTVVDNDPKGWYFNNFLGNYSKLIKFVNADLTKETFVIDPQTTQLYHLASSIGTKELVNKGAKMIGDNVDMTANVIRSIKKTKHRIKVVFSSSIEVYAGAGYDRMFTEMDDIRFSLVTDRWSYAYSKWVCEWMLRLSTIDVCITRLCNVYGEGMKQDYVIKAMIQRMMGGVKEMDVRSPQDTRPFTYVEDTVTALIALMDNPHSTGQIFNVGSPTTYTIQELAEAIAINGKFDLSLSPLPQQGSENRLADTSKLEDFTGVVCNTSLDDGLKKTIKWYKENTA